MNNKFLPLILFASIAFTALILLFLHELSEDRAADNDQTMVMTDSMRHTLKVAILNQRAFQAYPLALRQADEEMVYEALDLMSASLGFVFSGYIENQELFDKVVPLIRENINLIELTQLGISGQDLQLLQQNFRTIDWQVEQLEKDIWTSFQRDYVAVQNQEHRLHVLYQIAALVAFLLLIIIGSLFLRQRSLLCVVNRD